MDQPPRLWFEYFYRNHGIPNIVWAVVGFLPFPAIYVVTIFLAGLSSEGVSSVLLPVLPFFPIINLYLQYASGYASSRVTELAERWQLEEKHSISLGHLFTLKGPTIASLVVYPFLLPIFDFYQLQYYTPYQVLLIGVIPWLYYAYFFRTFFWVVTYSAFAIYKMGKLPLELKHFTEDRTLGLREFGSASLRLAALAIVLVALFVIPNTIQGFSNLTFLFLHI